MAVPVYEIVEGGEDWRKQLPERPVTPNMMRWQRFYEAPCGFACCFSPDCACLRCSGCGKSLTSLPPKARFQCMDCEILPPETPFDPRPELCVACFGSDQALHWHSRFLLVDERGAHRAVERKLGLAEPKLVTPADFPKVAAPDAAECGICCCDFDGDATAAPGCRAGHGEGVPDPRNGVVDSGGFYHADCRMSWMQAQKSDRYCGELPLSCRVCLFEKEAAAWRADFQRGFDAIRGFGGLWEGEEGESLRKALGEEFQVTLDRPEEVRAQFALELKKLHPQLWLHAIIDSISTSE